MNKPKISIIVPVYDTEVFLCQCIDSILNQTFKNFELLLVDDGSTDGSGEICDEYACKDERVHVYHKQNQGISTTRNFGLQYAQGEWIYFVDSDDTLKSDALKYMTDLINEQTSFVMCGFEEYDEEGHLKFTVKRRQDEISIDMAIKEMFTPSDYYFQGFLWCKLFKTSIILENHIQFNTQVKFNEDRLFIVEYLCHAKGKVAYSTIPVYQYTIHPTGVTASLFSRFNPDYLTDLDTFVKMGQLLRKQRRPKELMDAHYTAMMLDSVLRMYYFCNKWGKLNLQWVYKIESRALRGAGACRFILPHLAAVRKFLKYYINFEYDELRNRYINECSNYSIMKPINLIKKIIKHLLPKPIKIYLGDINNMRKSNNSTLWEAIRNAHVYKSDSRLTSSDDFLHQFSKMRRNLNTNIRDNYVYPYNTWRVRGLRSGVSALVSITVDYSIVLNSSLNELTKRVQACSDESFKNDEQRMIEGISSIASHICSSLNKGNTTREKQLSHYYAHMLNNKPESFDEAIQKLLFYNALFWQVKHWHNGLGRLDLIFEEYYNKDVQAGKLTREQAKTMLIDFVRILGRDTRAKSLALIGDTGQYILLGGVDEKGRTVQNDLTELFLEIFTELKVPDPKLILRVNEHTSDIVWKKAVDCVITGCGSPLLMNEKLIMDGMMEFGYKKEDVWNVGTSACWEPLIIGKSFDQNNPFPNFPVVTALNDVIHSGMRYDNIDAIVEATKCNIAKQIKDIIHDITFDVSPLYSLFFDSCIERGKDYSQGGADYAYHGVQVVGLPNLVNALLNIKKYVFEQKILSLDQCRGALAANFVGYEDVREMLLANDLKFGNSHPDVVAITNDLMSFISKEVEKYTCNGEKLKVGFSSSQYIMARMKSKASLDGRKDYDPFAVHISPVSQKIDIQEVLDFAGSLDYSGNRMNGNVVDFILPSAYIKQKDKLVTILKNAMTNGVYELQLNVLDAATLRDAKAHPEKYPNLVVRVWGFSAYFNDLPEEYKDNLIARAEAYE